MIDDAGRLIYVQDAYTIVRPLPARPGVRPGRRSPATGLGGDPFNYIRNSVKITMDAYDGTMNFYVADRADPLIRAYAGVFPTLFKPIDAMPGRPARPPARPRGAVQRPDPGLRPLPRDRPAALLPERRPVDGARRADQRAEPPVRGLLRDHADARRGGAEFLLLQPMVPTAGRT